MIKKVIKKGKINDFFDVYSAKQVSKFEVLKFLEKKYGLKYSIKKVSQKEDNLTKRIYFSKNTKAKSIGYLPEFTSLGGIQREIEKMNL